MHVLLVNPETPDTFWSFRHVLRFVSKKAAFPPLGLLTVAAMMPDSWHYRLVDLNFERLRDEDLAWADHVMMGGMLVHAASAREVARRCAEAGRALIAGGPLFTTGHADFPEIPHFVLGEAEEVMAQLVADMRAGTVRSRYQAAGRPDLRTTPVPRWDLVNLRHYVTMAVQFSRGCPYDCEFCDIIVMNGRVPRTKAPGRLVAELEALRRRGWRDGVFVVDDNFIGNKARTRELLRAVIHWRRQTRPGLFFLTEASVNLADDPGLCALMVEAGFRKVFVGIETPADASLEECRKLQNQGRDLVSCVHTLQAAGLEVMGGFIVGFDSDPADICVRQFDFIQRSGVVTAMVGLLNALPQTRLWQRLQREGRLLGGSSGNNTASGMNFMPKLDLEMLQRGYRELMRGLYEPRAYYQRIRMFLRHHRPAGPRSRFAPGDLWVLAKACWILGLRHSGRWAYWRLCGGTLMRRPRQFARAVELAIIGHHFRRIARAL